MVEKQKQRMRRRVMALYRVVCVLALVIGQLIAWFGWWLISGLLGHYPEHIIKEYVGISMGVSLMKVLVYLLFPMMLLLTLYIIGKTRNLLLQIAVYVALWFSWRGLYKGIDEAVDDGDFSEVERIDAESEGLLAFLRDAENQAEQQSLRRRQVSVLLRGLFIVAVILLVFFVFPFMMDPIAGLLNWNNGVFEYGIFIYWLVIMLVAYVDIQSHFYDVPHSEFWLYVFLIVLYVLALACKYIDISPLTVLYTPYASPIQNLRLQTELDLFFVRYAELLVDWSLLQGIILGALDFSGVPQRIKQRQAKKQAEQERKWQEEMEKDTQEITQFTKQIFQLLYALRDEALMAFVEFLMEAYEDPAQRTAIAQYPADKASLPPYVFEEREYERLEAFIQNSLKLEEDDDDPAFVFTTDEAFVRGALCAYCGKPRFRARPRRIKRT